MATLEKTLIQNGRLPPTEPTLVETMVSRNRFTLAVK